MGTSLNKLIFEYQLEVNFKSEENLKLFSGLSKLDFFTHGFNEGSLNIIAARKGNGLQTFRNTLLNNLELQTTIFLKKNETQFLYSFLSSTSSIMMPKIHGKFFEQHELNHLNKSIKEISSLPIFIKKKKKLSLDFLINYLSKNEDSQCVIIEDLDSFLEKEKILFSGLKKIAKKYNVILVCFLELNPIDLKEQYLKIKPNIKDFKNKFPLKSTLKSIDNLIFSFRPEFYEINFFNKTKIKTENKAELDVFKNNNESKNMIVKFSGVKNIFSDLEDYEDLNWVEKLKVLNC